MPADSFQLVHFNQISIPPEEPVKHSDIVTQPGMSCEVHVTTPALIMLRESLWPIDLSRARALREL